MTASIRDHLSLHANALTLREQRNGVLASNIANAATPGFKARDFDFHAALQARLGTGGMQATDNHHFTMGNAFGGALGYRAPVSVGLDGNTVELSVEQMEFAENTMRYQASLTLLNRRISDLTTAIKGE